MNETVYNTADDKESKPKTEEESGGDIPIFANQSIGAAAWANKDTNGNYYLSVQVPLLQRFNLFVPDEYKAAFNQFVEHIGEEAGGDA